MKKLLLLLIASTLFVAADAQVLKRLQDRAKQAAERNAGNKVDRAVNDIMDGKTNSNPKPASENNEAIPASNTSSDAKGKAPVQSLKAYSKFDFVPGDVILYAEDFSQDVVGEFPVKWNTNGS